MKETPKLPMKADKSAKAPKDFKPKGMKANLSKRLAQRNYKSC